MVILITGASHTGKTALAQRLLQKYNYPYLSLDHLKMGLIRSGYTSLTPLSSDDELTAYLWPVAREIIKTAVENKQNLIVEGCYIPFDWKEDFGSEYIENIRFLCLIMSEDYIKNQFYKIIKYGDIIESRLEKDCSEKSLLKDNASFLALAVRHNAHYILIDEKYNVDEQLELSDILP